jgi:hypothetical protein
MNRFRSRWRPIAACLAIVLASGGCAREVVGPEPDLDRPHFPTGLAVHPNERLLAVVSSNFDLSFSRGALLLADLARVDAALEGADPAAPLVITDPWVAAAKMPSFGNRPVFALGGEHVLIATRGENLIAEAEVVVTENATTIDCSVVDDDGVPLCGQLPRVARTPGNDPFDVVITSEQADRVRGVASMLSSNEVVFFELRPGENGANRLQTPGTLALTSQVPDGEEALGVRGLALRPGLSGATPHAFATVERTAATLEGRKTDLVYFDVTQRWNARPSSIDLTDLTGALGARALAVSPSGDAVFTLLREPDGLARIDVDSAGGGVNVRLGGIATTCDAPTGVVTARIPTAGGDVDRVFVTCFENDTVLGYDPVTLTVTDAVRFAGQGPYDLVVDTSGAVPRAYVSFFLDEDENVGVLDLLDDTGGVRLSLRGYLGRAPDAEAQP